MAKKSTVKVNEIEVTNQAAELTAVDQAAAEQQPTAVDQAAAEQQPTAAEPTAAEQQPTAAEPTAAEPTAAEQQPTAAEPTAAELTAVDQAAAELEELKAKMAEAKKKLAEAKKANAKQRPVRMSTFAVLVCDTHADAELAIGDQMTKSDVHYCAEKAAIDVLAEDIKCGNHNDHVYAVVKYSKAFTENGEPEALIVVECLWIDAKTNQIVIK